jgi:hypothetical protein
MVYDPAEKSRINRQYYEQHKKLKGRRPGGDTDTGDLPSKQPKPDPTAGAAARVERLTGKVETLKKALSVAVAALSAARQKESKSARESSDGKSTAKEKRDSQEFRDKHKEELKAKAKKESTSSSSSSGGSSSSSSSSKSVSDMSAEELGSRIIKIKSALREANRQLSSAKQNLGQMAHSAILSDPKVNAHFARFQSERIPSK